MSDQQETNLQIDCEAIRHRHEAARNMVSALCKPRHEEGARDWIMSIPARPDYDPDLVIGAALRDVPKLLKQIEQRESDRFVPGLYCCRQCHFVNAKSNLHAADGSVTASRSEPEPCPNDGQPMRRVTWREQYEATSQLLSREIADLYQRLENEKSTCASLRAKLAEPVPMILHCPRCGLPHVDAPEPENGWLNPPHTSHLCHNESCVDEHGNRTVFRLADVPTNGVATIQTRGSRDTWSPMITSDSTT